MMFGAVSSGCIALSWWCSPTQQVHFVVLCFKNWKPSHFYKKFYFICDQICPYLSLLGNQIVDYTRVHAWKPHMQSRTWPTFLLWRKLTGVTVCSTSHSLNSSCWKEAIASLFFSKIQSITAEWWRADNLWQTKHLSEVQKLLSKMDRVGRSCRARSLAQ